MIFYIIFLPKNYRQEYNVYNSGICLKILKPQVNTGEFLPVLLNDGFLKFL